MSYPYPEDRTRQKRTKGEQPYKDARETMRESKVRQTAQEEEYGEEHLSPRNRVSDEARKRRLEAEMQDELQHVGEQVSEGDGSS